MKVLFFAVSFCLLVFSSPSIALALTYEEAQSNSLKLDGAEYFSVFVDPSGFLSGMGIFDVDTERPLRIPVGITDVKQVAATNNLVAVLRSNGELSFLGDHARFGLPSVLNDVVKVSCGWEHVAVLFSTKTVTVYGSNYFGVKNIPSEIQGKVEDIASGAYHVLALTDEKRVYAWGNNDYGQCNVPPSAATGVKQIAAGSYHNVVLKTDGSVVCWGFNLSNQCNISGLNLTNVIRVDAGTYHSAALRSDGTVVVWGDKTENPHRLGQFVYGPNLKIPSSIQGKVVGLSCGGRHTLVLTSDDYVVGWGDNGYGQCLSPVRFEPDPEEKIENLATTFTVTYSSKISCDPTKITLSDHLNNTVPIRVTHGNNKLFIKPTVNLQPDRFYYLNFDTNSVKSVDSGLSVPATTYQFSTWRLFFLYGVRHNALYRWETYPYIVFFDNVTESTYTLFLDGQRISWVNGSPLRLDGNYRLDIWAKDNNNTEASCSVAFTICIPKRIYGSDRYSTAVELSKNKFNDSEYVVIATGENFPDALSAAPLAKALSSPILLTRKDILPSAVRDEILRLGAKKAVIIGGTGAVSSSVESALRTIGLSVERIGGRNRYETSKLVGEKLARVLQVTTFEKAYIATGENFPDALSVSPLAAKEGAPILLVKKDSVPSETQSFLKTYGVKKTVVIGGTGVISDAVKRSLPNPIRLFGPNRYATSVEIAKYAFTTLSFDKTSIYIATGENYPDALSSGVCAALDRNILLLVRPTLPLTSQTETFLTQNKQINKVTVIGGEGAVPRSVVERVLELIK